MYITLVNKKYEGNLSSISGLKPEPGLTLFLTYLGETMNSNFLPFTDEVWIKIDRMIVNLKSLKRGFQDGRSWHEDWDYREYERHR